MQMKMKKGLSLLLAFVLTLGVLAVGLPGLVTIGHAASDVWDGNYSDSSGFQNNRITSARGLAYFLNRVANGNTYSGATITLTVDINLDGINLSSAIPYYTTGFAGTFDGGNHTISNFTMTHDNHRVAMFRTANGATFKNVSFDNVWIDDTNNNGKNGFAVLVGYGDGNLTFENVHVNSGSVYGYNYVGGLVGEYGANSTIRFTDCSNGANISSDNDRAGGLVAHSKGSVIASNCSNTGNIYAGTSDGGGIAGWIEDDESSFTNCTNTGNVDAKICAGGIFGYFGSDSGDKKMTIVNCSNSGVINSRDNSGEAGGLAGRIQTDYNAHIITGNVNTGEVHGVSDAGGIVGYCKGFGVWENNRNSGYIHADNDNAGGILGETEDDKQTFVNCHNTGTVNGKTSTGGLAGYLNNANGNVITSCTNSGAITSSAGNAGGLIGAGNKEITFTDCSNTGNILGNNDSGGLAGSIAYHVFFTRCWNAGSVSQYNSSGKSYGGLIGYVSYYGSDTSRVMVVDCYNWGTITGGYVGGLVGYVNGGNNYKVTYSYNTGSLSGSNATWQFVGYGGNCGDGCYKIVNSGSGIYKTAQEFIDYEFMIDQNFKKNSDGVTVNGTTYYYPILGTPSGSSTMFATTSASGLYRHTVNYVIQNLTTGTAFDFSNYGSSQYATQSFSDDQGSGTLYKKTYQHDGDVTGKSTGVLVVDRAENSDLRDTHLRMDYSPHVYSSVGKARWGVKLYAYGTSIPDVAMDNSHNSVTVTSDKGNQYTYTLCDKNGNNISVAPSGNFTVNQNIATNTEVDPGTYHYYVKGALPQPGETVVLRMVAMCMAKASGDNQQLLTEWTDITIIGTCTHSDNWTVHESANELYYTCDSCGKRLNSLCPATVTSLPTAAGTTLTGETLYTVSSNTTITASAGQNALSVAAGATAVIYIPDGVTLTVTGGAGANGGNGTTGAANRKNTSPTRGYGGAGGAGGKAAIYVPPESTLIVIGGGTLNATGGRGGNAGNGATGARAMNNSEIRADEYYKGGPGGGGGGGAGGGGAAIGGNGGSGGTGGQSENMDSGQNCSLYNDGGGGTGGSGTGGGRGTNGGSAYIAAGITLNCTGGQSGNAGSGGSGGEGGDDSGSGWWNNYAAGGGGGGGGGGQGTAGAQIGGGGAGGGGGGAGGSGGHFSKSSGYKTYRAHGGAGGSNNGGAGSDGLGRDAQGWRDGGSGGGIGSAGTGRPSNTGVSPTDSLIINYITRFVFLNKEGGSGGIEVVRITIGQSMPNVTPPTKTGYTFQGYYNAKNGGGTKYYNANGTSAHIADCCTGELYAYWMPITYTVTFDGNGATGGSVNPNPQTFTYGTNQALAENGFTKTYTVSFDPDGGTVTGGNTTSVSAVFAGWATSATGAKVYNDKQSVGNLTTENNDNILLYAKWSDGSVVLPAAAKQNHILDGWYRDSALQTRAGAAGASCTVSPGATLYAKWIRPAQDDTYVLDYGLPTELNVLDNDAPGASLSSVASGTGFTASVSNGKILFTPTAALNAAVTFDYTLTYGGASYTASVTVIPANNVYYEETFFTFGQDSATFDYANNTAASWQSDGTALSRFQEGARPGAETSLVYGFDNAYTSNGMTYSLGTAQYAEVSANAKGGATASFTFTGTGFDFYSVTDNESGLTFVEIYRQTAGGSWENIESTLVNAYFGYKYGQLYLKNDQITLDNTGTPIYLAPEGQTDGTFFVDGMTRGWLTPTYKDGSGTLVTTQTEVPAYASGWVAGESDADGIYQVPVISRTGLDYGTYKVVVEPRWSARQNLTGGSSYKFYVDAVRVYDPIDPSTIISGSTAYNAYMAQGEYGATYQEVRDLLINSFGDTQGHGTPGVAFLEPGKGDALQDYKSIGPKNEVYLNPGQAIAFSLTTSAQTTPAKLSLGLRQVEGGSGAQVTVYSKNSTGVQINISGSTELYRDIGNAVAWQATTGAACTTSAPIIIANTGASGTVISITKLKWSYNTEVTPVSRMLSFSISPRDLVTASALLRQAAADAVAPDASGVRLQWNTKMISRSGVATLSITAPANFEKAYVNGAEIAGYTENADGTRTWRYDFSSYSVGKHAFDVRLKDANGYTTKAIAAEQVEVVATSNGQGTLTLQALLQRIFNSFLQALRALFRR